MLWLLLLVANVFGDIMEELVPVWRFENLIPRSGRYDCAHIKQEDLPFKINAVNGLKIMLPCKDLFNCCFGQYVVIESNLFAFHVMDKNIYVYNYNNSWQLVPTPLFLPVFDLESIYAETTVGIAKRVVAQQEQLCCLNLMHTDWWMHRTQWESKRIHLACFQPNTQTWVSVRWLPSFFGQDRARFMQGLAYYAVSEGNRSNYALVEKRSFGSRRACLVDLIGDNDDELQFYERVPFHLVHEWRNVTLLDHVARLHPEKHLEQLESRINNDLQSLQQKCLVTSNQTSQLERTLRKQLAAMLNHTLAHFSRD